MHRPQARAEELSGHADRARELLRAERTEWKVCVEGARVQWKTGEISATHLLDTLQYM